LGSIKRILESKALKTIGRRSIFFATLNHTFFPVPHTWFNGNASIEQGGIVVQNIYSNPPKEWHASILYGAALYLLSINGISSLAKNGTKAGSDD
jgi:hypothetical protein